MKVKKARVSKNTPEYNKEDAPKKTKKKSASAKELEEAAEANLNTEENFIIEPMGNTFKLGDTQFFSENCLFRIDLGDYTLITNDDSSAELLREHVPRNIKPLVESRWHYAIHLPQMQLSVTKKLLLDRVNGGEILAYKYTEANIEGNQCCYYGFLPTITHSDDLPNSPGFQHLNNIRDTLAFNSRGTTHRICRISVRAIWPRKLFVYIKRTYKCSCSPNCHLYQVMVRNSKDLHTFCLKKMPWSSLYIMMGDQDLDSVDTVKDLRTCPVCAQCFQCSKSATFCRRHRKCNHTKSMLFESNSSAILVADSKIKLCRKAT